MKTSQVFQYCGIILFGLVFIIFVFSRGHSNQVFSVFGPLLAGIGIDLILVGVIKKGSFYASNMREINRRNDPAKFWGTIVGVFWITNMVALVLAFSNLADSKSALRNVRSKPAPSSKTS